MKANLTTKILTGVVIVFFSCLSMGAEATPNRQQCNQKCDTESKSVCGEKPGSDAKPDDINKFNQCVRDAKQSCVERDGCAELDSARDIKQACEAAMDKYADAGAKSNEACAAFDKEGGKTCKEKANACDKKIKSLNSPFSLSSNTEDPDANDNGFAALKQIAMTSIMQKMGTAGNNMNGSLAAYGGACVKSIDRKARAQEKKDKDRERKELMEKIKTQKEKITEYKSDLDKERDENQEKVAELDDENKKDALEKDKKISDEVAKASKETVEIGKRIRAYSLAVTKEMQNLASTNFEYQSAMLELSDDKINQKCRQEFESLKAGLVSATLSSAPPGASAEEQKQYAALSALAAQYKAKGIQGSGEMKNMLISARKACYERANTSRNKNRMVNAQAVKNIQDKIDEIKKSMKDEQNAIATNQKNLEIFKTQTKNEKKQGDDAKMAKLDNLSKKLSAQIERTDEKTNDAKTRIEELTAEINNLAMVQNFEVEDAYSEAVEAINKGKTARNRAYEACNCEAQEGKGKKSDSCTQLAEDKAAYGKEKAPTKKAR